MVGNLGWRERECEASAETWKVSQIENPADQIGRDFCASPFGSSCAPAAPSEGQPLWTREMLMSCAVLFSDSTVAKGKSVGKFIDWFLT